MRCAEDKELALGPRLPGVSRQSWLYGEIRKLVLSGMISPGARLPPSRELARQLGVSRGTVLTVFDQLLAEGFLIGRGGSGTYVSTQLPEMDTRKRGVTAPIPAMAGRLSQRGNMLANSPFPIVSRSPKALPFRPNQPDLAAFPFALWNRITARRSRLSQREILADGDAHGYQPLRQAIAEHLRYSMRIDCSAQQILIVGSVQQALDLCARLLIDPGDEVLMEDPGYVGARQIFKAAGAKLIGVPVDGQGMVVDEGINLAPCAKLAYVTAGRHAPLGMPLALDRRLALLRWADRANAYVIEDDYDSEFRYSGSPLAAMKSFDTRGRVIYAGSFSKVMFPSLRLAYVVVPEWLSTHFAASLSLTARHMPLLPQAVLHEFIAEGHFGRHIRSMRILYGERAAALEASVRCQLEGLLTILPITTGLDAAALLPQGVNDIRIAKAAVDAGLETRPLSAYAIDAPAPSGLVLGFAPFDRKQIEKGVATLAQVIESALL